MSSLLDLRFLVLSGKGGVGRTTIAAALARAAAARGKRVLLAQTNALERLGRFLGRPGPIGPQIVSVADRLWAVNINPRDALHEYGLIHLKYEAVYRAVFENKTVRGFLAAIPGLDAYAMLGKAWYHTREIENGRPKYDLVILDAPATGHAEAMLRIPQAILDTMPHSPIGADARAVRDLMSDPARCALVIVTLAEELPVREAQQLATIGRHRLKMALGPLVVNGLPSKRLDDPDVANLIDRVTLPTGDQPLDATMRVAAGLRAHRQTANEMLARLRAEPGLPMIELPRFNTADLGPQEIARLANQLGAAL